MVIYKSFLAKLVRYLDGLIFDKSSNITIMLFGMTFTTSSSLSDEELIHEEIHKYQWHDCLIIFAFVSILLSKIVPVLVVIILPFIGYYIMYLIEWIIRIIQYGIKDSYKNISFEREAYENQYDEHYLYQRGLLNFRKYYIKHYKDE